MSADIAWPQVTTVPELLRALRGGFSLVQVPPPEGATASTPPSYRLSRSGVDSPPGVLSQTIVRVVQQRGLLGHPIHLADGRQLYKLKAARS